MSARTIAAAPAAESMNVGWKRSTIIARTPARKRTRREVRVAQEADQLGADPLGLDRGVRRVRRAGRARPATEDALTIPSMTCSRSASVAT